MNYENDYKFYYDKFYSKIENRIKQYFIEQCNKKRSFGITNNEIRMFLSNDLGINMYLNSNDDLKELLNKFNKRCSYYKEDEINLIVEHEIKPVFEKLNKNIYPKNYGLSKLLIQIALINAKNEISRLLQNNNRLFELFYDFNEFEHFEIKYYSPISLENTELFINFNKRKYPSLYNQESFNFEEEEDSNEINLKKTTLPLAIALLKEIGFFELEKLKSLSDTSLAKIIAIIQIKDPNNKSTKRAIAGNIRVLNPDSKENFQKYTSQFT